MSTNIPSKYNPKEFEDKIYKIWMDETASEQKLTKTKNRLPL